MIIFYCVNCRKSMTRMHAAQILCKECKDLLVADDLRSIYLLDKRKDLYRTGWLGKIFKWPALISAAWAIGYVAGWL